MISVPIQIPLHIQRRGLPLIDSVDRNSPTGLFSSSIFGVTQDERKRQGATVALNTQVIRPNVLMVLKRVSRELYNCATSKTNYVVFKDGSIIAEEKYEGEITPEMKVGYGPQFVYDYVWDKIDKTKFEMEEGTYINKSMKSAFKKYRKEDVFTAFQYVPAIAYREEPEEDSAILQNELNVFLSDIVRYSNILLNNTLDIDNYDLQVIMQKAVEKLYNYLYDRYIGPKGAFRKQFMSRSVVNSVRLTIVPNSFISTVIGDNPYNIETVGVPLHHVVNMYKDFFIKYSRDFLMYLYEKGCFGETDIEMLDIYDTQYWTDLMADLKVQHTRVKPFMAIQNDGTFKPMEVTMDVDLEGNGSYTSVTKELSNMEFFYIVSTQFIDVTNTKAAMVTRYPTDSALSTQSLKPFTTTLFDRYLKSVKFFEMDIKGYYPYVDDYIKKYYYRNVFEQSLRVSQSVTVGWNGIKLPLHMVTCVRNYVKSWKPLKSISLI
ncbi:MAG: hypothetical protein ACRC92_20690 [Peptostreptococcaceae bacterium]